MIHSNYIRQNRIVAALTFFASFFIYFSTMASTVSYWDCGEFIATAYTLGVPHPPGSPFFLLIGRVISMLPFHTDVAFRVNILSPLSSALAVMLLYLVVVKVVTHWRGKIENSTDAIIAFGGAAVGAMAFAFTDSHWFNAVEAEVYAISTFFTAIVVWLILLWSEKADEAGHERYILIIAYMMGLATGLHLLNLLALPFIALIMYFRKYTFEWKSFLATVGITGVTFYVIHNIIIKGLPHMAASSFGMAAPVLFVILIFAGMVWAVMNKHHLLSVALTSIVMILIGYSTYTTIFVRSNQNPTIDENDPETVEAFVSYLEREQYGSVGTFPRRYKGIEPIHEVVGRPENGRDYSPSQESQYRSYNSGKQWDYFWSYQVRKMYNRYFLWQFAGKGLASDPTVSPMGAKSSEDGVDWNQFGLPLAFILGLFGMMYHAYKDERMAFSVLALFVMTGYAIIVYLNQDDPQPRERDYSYVGSFYAFAIWIGVGAAGIGEKISEYFKDKVLGKRLIMAVLILQFALIPGVMLKANYHSHDRSGNFVAWDYSYNILQSVAPNGIIFTNGDNDTFPLWYLQEVENLRTDVAVVNLSLLNTPWYIKQMRDSRPDSLKFIRMTDNQIDQLTSNLMRWETQKIKVPVYNDSKNKEGFIEWTVKPTFAGQALRVQDLMILRIINDARWKVPIFFAVTVSNTNRIGLDQYIDMQGLTFQLKSHKTQSIDLAKMTENLMTDVGDSTWSTAFNPDGFNEEKETDYLNWSRDYQSGYLFRNLGNEDVYFNPQIIRLLQNYRSAYMQLAVTYYMDYQKEKRSKNPDADKLASLKEQTIAILKKMSENIPENTIPMSSSGLYYQVGRIYGELGEKDELRTVLEDLISRQDIRPKERIEYGNIYLRDLDDSETAIQIFEMLLLEFQQIESMVRVKGFSRKSVSQKQWTQWQQTYPDIISSLVYAYKSTGQIDDAKSVLNDWLQKYPNDKAAKKMLESFEEKG
mgnify:FL=1